ncbi:MAG: tRNA 2-selenouridine(34) synthase MnmH [Burkholderiales bacterium]|nr:tRNA 2-selenouridine(34) synthase MnmH [Burkholderiales bacterium]
MSLRRISPADAIARLAEFDTVIDARSESEYAEDRLPRAENWPSLNDDERHRIGTEYVQVSPFAARKRGAALVARNIARHVETRLDGRERDWRPLVYCWRGGQRSGALALVLDQIGYAVHVLDGGYQAFRRHVRAELEHLPDGLALRMLCGRTGSAKSRLLQALAAQGAQVLDLEALACHRGSVLGPMPGQPQPTQKAFDTRVWEALRSADLARPLFVEGESRTIGRLRVPERLLETMRAAPCLRVELALAQRVELLLQDYGHFVADVGSFCARLDALRELRGAEQVAQWQVRARAGDLAAVVRELLEIHYDPIYERSMPRNFKDYAGARVVDLPAADAATLARIAVELIAG